MTQITANPNDDSNVASARGQSASASQLVSTLVPTLLIAVAFFFAFVILRARFPRQYAPRTYLGALRPQERTPPLPNSLFGWLKPLNKIPDTYVLQHNSLDAFFLLRYLKMSVIITFVGCLFIWPILLPVNATGHANPPRQQMDILTIGNIDPNSSYGYRYYAHALLAWIYVAFIFFLVTREMIFYINLRQAYLLSPLYAERMSSRTVLFQSVPLEYANETKIRLMFGDQLKNVWIASATKKLEDMVEERTKLAMKLEGAEAKLIKRCNDARLKQIKKSGEADSTAMSNTDPELSGGSGSVAARWISPKERPTHRLKPLIGRKVDSINYCRERIGVLNALIEKEQENYRAGRAPPRNAVFVEFWRQTDAQAAFQMVTHHQALHMSPRVVGLQPEEVIWSNLGITWRTLTIRNIISIAIVVVLIIFWSVPVAVVGSASNINFLATKVHFLKWILDIPNVILGVITGLLPSLALSILMALLPPFLRFLGKFSGKATLSLVELRCHESYFWFQVVQVFLVTTMTSAASSAIPQLLNDPSSAPQLLSQSLPASSNFYISYFILQGLTFASGALLQIAGLVLFYLMSKFLDKTPRKMYKRWSELSDLGWGTVFPVSELLTVISITYSCIAPIMMGFATIGGFLFYFAYRYNLLFVNTSTIDTKGLVYAKALKHTLVGCYLLVICLLGLFGVASGGTGKGPLVMMIILLVFMILFHISLNNAINPLLHYLPRSLEAEEDALLQAENGSSNENPVLGDEKTAAFRSDTKNRSSGGESSLRRTDTYTSMNTIPAPAGFVGMLKKFFRPDIYASYAIMRRLVPHDFAHITYTPEIERDAYQHPAVIDEAPLLWVPRDIMGVSRQECAHTNMITPITDEAANFNDKGRIVWSEEETGGRPPIWEERIYY